jgi:hypothetical protein
MFPKWITRAQGIGPVLVQNEAEETQLMNDWEMEQLELAEKAAADAKVAAQAAEDEAKVVLKPQKGK